jgi:predicted lysophospholipase L1 biosynthesis ABC-type transport system permease subunit
LNEPVVRWRRAKEVRRDIRTSGNLLRWTQSSPRTGGALHAQLKLALSADPDKSRSASHPARRLSGPSSSTSDSRRLSNFKTENDRIAETTGQERVFSRLLTLFAAFAIVLAGIGLYGLTSYAVARRTNEIGIRLALCATRGRVRGLMLRQVVVLALVGLIAGVPLALLLARFVGTFVFGITPRDPETFVIVAVTMLAAAIAAGWVPARRAARLEPLSALRAE